MEGSVTQDPNPRVPLPGPESQAPFRGRESEPLQIRGETKEQGGMRRMRSAEQREADLGKQIGRQREGQEREE